MLLCGVFDGVERQGRSFEASRGLMLLCFLIYLPRLRHDSHRQASYLFGNLAIKSLDWQKRYPSSPVYLNPFLCIIGSDALKFHFQELLLEDVDLKAQCWF